MINDLQIFNHKEFGEIRIVDQNGEPWFIARDVALRLGYKNPAKAINDHCKKVNKITQENATLSRHLPPTNFLIIPESDVYQLVMRSELPNAKKFQDWVCEEVLPSIRKTGSYTLLAPFEIPKNENEWIDCTLQLLGKYKTAVEKNIVLVEKVDDLSIKLGNNENWKRVSAIPWLKKYFNMSKAPGVYQTIGKELTRMTRLMNYEKKFAKSFMYANAIGVYHIDVIGKLEEELKMDGDLLKEYRRPKLKRRNRTRKQLRLIA